MTETLSPLDCLPAFGDLVSYRGWSLLHCTRDPAGALSAAIAKDGVVLAYTSFRAEAEYTITLQRPVHPTVTLHAYSPPSVLKILKDNDIQCDASVLPFVAIDQNLRRIRAYLTDATIFRRDVEAASKKTAENYHSWIKGPDFTRNLAQGLAASHPWLVTGKTPALSDLTWTDPSVVLSRRLRSGMVVGALGLGLLLIRCLT